MDTELYSILQLCWQHSPAARPNFSTVIEKLVTYRLSKTLSNEPAKKFWKTNFDKENMVSLPNGGCDLQTGGDREVPYGILG